MAQDFFELGLIPADTGKPFIMLGMIAPACHLSLSSLLRKLPHSPLPADYRMFSHRHYGNLPGIDIAFHFGGTAYHTARDEQDRIRPGTLQARRHTACWVAAKAGLLA